MTATASRSPGSKFLTIYLNDHLAGSAAGVELARGLAAAGAGGPADRVLRELSADISQDRAALLHIMSTLDVRPRRYKAAAGWLAEKARRLKLNGTLGARSPLTSLVELEMLGLGVAGKAAGWRALRSMADTEPRLDPGRLNELIARAGQQSDKIEDLRIRAARRALVTGASPAAPQPAQAARQR
jgi:hypothetical protein